MIGGSIVASIFGQTTFLADIVAHPVTTTIILGKYVYDFFAWLGVPAIGVLCAVIVEVIIFCFVVKLFCMLVISIKSIINLFRKDRK